MDSGPVNSTAKVPATSGVACTRMRSRRVSPSVSSEEADAGSPRTMGIGAAAEAGAPHLLLRGLGEVIEVVLVAAGDAELLVVLRPPARILNLRGEVGEVGE